MKRSLFLLPIFASIFLAFATHANPVGQSVSYVKSDSRTQFPIQAASGTATFEESADLDGYVMSVDYSITVAIKGQQDGVIKIYVPNDVFDAEFVKDLAVNGTEDLGLVKAEYKGTAEAQDAAGNSYQAHEILLSNFDAGYRPDGSGEKAFVVSHDIKTNAGLEASDIQLTVKLAAGVPGLGAVQMDMTAMSSMGLPITAGLDYQPQ